MAVFRVLSINVGCETDKTLENSKPRRSAISNLINEQDPDIILFQNASKRRDIEFIDYTLSKVFRYYNYYMKRARNSTAIMTRANLFTIEKVKCSDLNIVGTAEQKDTIQNSLSLVRLTHRATKNTMFIGSWSCPVHIGMTDEKKKRITSLLVSLMRREAVAAFWMIGGDFDVAYDQNSVRMAQKVDGQEFINLVEDTGRIAYADENADNYFIFSGKSGHRRMALQKVSTPQCITGKQQSVLQCSPVSGTVSITWAAASPRHEFRVPSSPSPRLSHSATSSHYEFRVPSCSPRLSRSSSRSSSYST